MTAAREKEQSLAKLCSKACYRGDIEQLEEDAREAGAEVQQIWAPIDGGSGFAAFTARMSTGTRDVLVVVFRGTQAPEEWMRYPLVALSGIDNCYQDVEGVQMFSVWAETVKQVWNNPGLTRRGFPMTMRQSVLGALGQGQEVCLAGHSMGGANAQCVAALLVLGDSGRFHRQRLYQLSVVTYNAPMALLERDAIRYEQVRGMYQITHRRIEQRADIVRNLPPGIGLRHMGDQEMRGEGLWNPALLGAGLLAAVAVGNFAWNLHRQASRGHQVITEGEEEKEEERT